MNPLNEFKSENVYQLLKEFYYLNFQEYGVSGQVGLNMVEYIWENKGLVASDLLRQNVAKVFDTTNLETSKTRKEVSLIDLFDLSKVNHFVDVGANNLARINEVARKYPNIKLFTAIDVVPQSRAFRYPEKSNYIQISQDSFDYPIENHSCDFINLEFVLHHFKSESLIKSHIKTFKRVLRPGGVILLWEESFENSVNVGSLVENNNKLSIMTNFDLTSKFYSLTPSQRLQFIKINDWIINVNIPHMQWTGQWKPWEKWMDLFTQEGFFLTNKYNLGLRVNGRLKQGVHIIGQLTASYF